MVILTENNARRIPNVLIPLLQSQVFPDPGMGF
jgi:hypothetical protein